MKKNNNGILKRALAILLAVILMIPTGLVAMADPIVGEYDDMVVTQGRWLYYDEAGNAVGENDEWVVRVLKEAHGTGVENQFEITLTVETKEKEMIVPRTEAVPVDIVLVFDLSGSMNSTRWGALKGAADAFINNIFSKNGDIDPDVRVSIVAYGGGGSDNGASDNYQRQGGDGTRQYKTIQNWSTNPTTLKSSYNYGSSAAMAGADPAIGQSTNCQAGFYSADLMLDSARDGALQYVVYMSDGEANRWYYPGSNVSGYDREGTRDNFYVVLTKTGNLYRYPANNIFTGGTSTGTRNARISNVQSETTAARHAAIAQSGMMKQNHPSVKLFTVGLGTDSSKVLKDGANNNPYVDRYFYGTEVTLGSIYQEISETIRIESSPWTVSDNMGQYVTYTVDSVNNEYASYDDSKLTWSIADESENSEEGTTTYTASYIIDLNMEQPDVWKDGQANPANGITTLTFNVAHKDKDGNVTYSETKVVNFAIPTVKANLYTYTFKYYYDDELDTNRTDILEFPVGNELDLGARAKGKTNYTFLKVEVNGDAASLSDSITTGSETNNTVVEYYYKSGYPLTINYLEQGSSNELATSFYGVYTRNASYSVTSPTIPGYELVNAAQATVSGTKKAETEIINVYYKKIDYSVVYRFEGAAPYDCDTVDSNTYHIGDPVTVADAPVAEGWIFTGWDKEDFTIGETTPQVTTITGTWSRITYELDVIYTFNSEDDWDDFCAYQEAAGQAAVDAAMENFDPDGDQTEDEYLAENNIDLDAIRAAAEAAYLAALEAVVGTFNTVYTAADGTMYTNVFVKQEATEQNHGYPYSFTAATNIPDFKSSGTVSGTLTQNTTVIFPLFNDQFTVTIYHEKLTKSNGYETVDTELYTLRAGDNYSVAAKSYPGFYVSGGAAIGDYTMGTEDVTYNIYYDPYLYDVTFAYVTIDNPDTPDVPDAQNDIWEGDRATDPVITAPTGWTFDGWYTDVNLTAKYDFSTPVTKNLTLYGAWSRKTYSVSFVVQYNYGTGTAAERHADMAVDPATQTGIAYEDFATDPAYTPIVIETAGANYAFSGWYTDSTCETSFIFNTPITANTTLYGVWNRTTNAYPYKYEHYLDGTLFATIPGATADYGTPISVLPGDILGTEGLKTHLGETLAPHVEYFNGVGCTITEVEENNVVKLYYVTKKYTLTINYVFESTIDGDPYETNGSAFPSYSAQVTYDEPFNVVLQEGNVIPNYTARAQWEDSAYTLANPTGNVGVSGQMPGHNLTLTVYYNPNPRYRYTINYLELGTSKVVDTAYTSELIFVGESYDIPAGLTSGNTVTNYTYHSYQVVTPTGGTLSGTMPEGGVVVNVYYVQITYTLYVKHYNMDKDGPSFESFNSSQTLYASNDYYYEAFALTHPDLPDDYKLVSLSHTDPGAIPNMNTGKVIGANPGKDVTVQFYYNLKDKAYVTVNYLDESNTPIYTSYRGTFNEGDPYDVSGIIYPTLGDYDQYTYLRDDAVGGYTGTLASDDNIVINVIYSLKSYPYTVEFWNGYTNELIEEIDDGLTAPFGTTLTAAMVGADLDDEGWVLSRRPEGYNLQSVIYPTIAVEGNVVKVYYNLNSYGYTVEFWNGSTNTLIEEIADASLTASFGTTLNDATVATDLNDEDWLLSRLPEEYYLASVTYPQIGTGSNVVVVVYNVNSYPYSIEFWNGYTDELIEVIADDLTADFGTTLNETTVADDLDNANWLLSRMPAGYFLSSTSYPTIAVEGNVVIVEYDYAPEPGTDPVPETFTVTVEYYAGDTSIATSRTRNYTTYSGRYSFDVEDFYAATIGEYVLISGDYQLTGTARNNVTIRLLYELPEDPGGDEPGGDEPGGDEPGGEEPGGEEQEFEIPEEEVPLGELPEIEEFEIIDEEVPLGDLPQTGFAIGANGLGFTAAMSMIATGWAVFGGKKKEEDDE